MSVENDKLKSKDESSFVEDRVNTPMIKYFWQASPLAGSKKTSINKFLRKIHCFNHFSDFELYTLSKFLHLRVYSNKEVVFSEGDGGFGFYLILNGSVNVFTEGQSLEENKSLNHVAELAKYDYFGELALLEEQNRRNATAISSEATTLMAIYKPDLEELIERNPVVGAKLLQGLSLIVAKRLNAIAIEFKCLKDKIKVMEDNGNKEEL